MSALVTRMIGTLAVILVLAFTIGGSGLIEKSFEKSRGAKYVLLAGLLGGAFGIYGNISGMEYNGALMTVRDMGPMLAGFIGGPVGGFIAGLIAGAHRLFLGGITAQPCIIATCCIGTVCGLLAEKRREELIQPHIALFVGAVAEVFHLCVLLVMVKPYETAEAIVRGVAVPFVVVNSVGFMLLITTVSVVERNRRMMIEQSRLQTELEAATTIQRSLLPPVGEMYRNRSEFSIAGLMDPAKEVGGDFYDSFYLGADRIALIIGDVSGKGIPAALFMAAAKESLQNNIRGTQDFEEAVAFVNDDLCRNNEADMFVTAWIGILEIATGRIEYISAGHNPPVLITEAGTEFLDEKSSFVLAGLEGIKYKKQEMTLGPGDKLLIYTDGVTEAEASDHSQYGNDRLLKCLDESKEKDPGAVIEGVRADIRSFVKDAEQFDDITMLCIRMDDAVN